MKAGFEATRRIIGKINEAQQDIENSKTFRMLINRVDDWRGHHFENFGSLLMSDNLRTTKTNIDRDYVAVLFEKVFVFFKEFPKQNQKSLVGGSNTTLQLKGRIFIGNITQTVIPKSAGIYQHPSSTDH